MPDPLLEKRSIDSDLYVLDLHRSQRRLYLVSFYVFMRNCEDTLQRNSAMFHFPRAKSFCARYQLIFLLSNVVIQIVQQSISTSRHSWRAVVVLLISEKVCTTAVNIPRPKWLIFSRLLTSIVLPTMISICHSNVLI